VTHLVMELFSNIAQVKIATHPLQGNGVGLADLISGQVQLLFTSSIIVIPHVKSGKLKVIAISGEHRLPSLPEVPTFAEAGMRGFDVKVWNGVLAPARTPKGIMTNYRRDRQNSEHA